MIVLVSGGLLVTILLGGARFEWRVGTPIMEHPVGSTAEPKWGWYSPAGLEPTKAQVERSMEVALIALVGEDGTARHRLVQAMLMQWEMSR